MSVISVRLDKETETRLRQEAKAQGLRFSDFLRKRLTGEQQESVEAEQRELDERIISALRDIKNFLCLMEREQWESYHFTQYLVIYSLQYLFPENREGTWRVWNEAMQKLRELVAREEGKSS